MTLSLATIWTISSLYKTEISLNNTDTNNFLGWVHSKIFPCNKPWYNLKSYHLNIFCNLKWEQVQTCTSKVHYHMVICEFLFSNDGYKYVHKNAFFQFLNLVYFSNWNICTLYELYFYIICLVFIVILNNILGVNGIIWSSYLSHFRRII